MTRIFSDHFRLCAFSLVMASQIVLTDSVTAQAPVIENVTELGQLDLNSKSPSDESLAFVWGFTKDAREFAAVPITDGGVSIVDVTDPANPFEASFVEIPSGAERLYHVKHYDGFLYAVMRPGPLQIIDVTNPDSAFTAALYKPDFSGVYSLFITKDLLHLSDVDGASGNKKSIFLDISNPTTPVEIGAYFRGYHHSYIRGDTLFGWNFAGYCDWLDISDLQNIQAIKQWSIGDQSHGGWLNDDGTLLSSDQELPGGHLKVWDLKTSTPSLKGEFATVTNNVGETSIHHSMWYDDLIYMSYWRDGFRVADASDPANIVQVGAFDNDHPNSAGLLRGGWGVFPYLPSRNVLYTDRKRALYILDFHNDGPGLRHDPHDVVYAGSDTLRNTFSVINGPDLDISTSKVYCRTGTDQAWNTVSIQATGVTREYEFEIEIPDEEAEKLKTVQDVVTYLAAKGKA